MKKRWQCTWSTTVYIVIWKRGFTTKLYFMYIVTPFLYFTTQSCTSCTLSPLFYVSLHTELYFMYIVTSFLCFTTELYFMYIVTSFSYFTTKLYFMHIVTSFLCFTTHRAVQGKIKKRWQCTWSTALCVVKHKKEVTTYMKNSCV
jgi:hypothetical protein